MDFICETKTKTLSSFYIMNPYRSPQQQHDASLSFGTLEELCEQEQVRIWIWKERSVFLKTRVHVFDFLINHLEKEIRHLYRENVFGIGRIVENKTMIKHLMGSKLCRWRAFCERIENVCRHPFCRPSLLLKYDMVEWRWDLLMAETTTKRHNRFLTTNNHDWVSSMIPFPILRTTSNGRRLRHGGVGAGKENNKRYGGGGGTSRGFFVGVERRILNGYRFNSMNFRKWSRSCLLPLALVVAHNHLRWDFTHLLKTRRWTLRWLVRLHHCRRLCFRSLSHNLFLTPEILLHFKDAPWDWKVLSSNPAIPPSVVLEGIRQKDPFRRTLWKLVDKKWRWSEVWSNPMICDDVFFHLSSSHYVTTASVPVVSVSVPYKRGLLMNHFMCDPRLQVMSAVKIQRMVRARFFVRRMLQNMKILAEVSKVLPHCLVPLIFSFMEK